MKKTSTLLIGIAFLITITNAQEQVAPPQSFSFKATITGASGQTVINKMINLRITILQDDVNGTPVYSEFFTPTTNHYSQVDLEIGRGNVLSGIFSSIDWSTHKYFLKIEVDIKGGTNYQLLSVTQLLSVPYALYAAKAGNGFDGKWGSLTGKPTTIAGYEITDAVTTSGDQTISGNKTFNDQITASKSLSVNGNAEINGDIIPNGEIVNNNKITIESKNNNVIVLAGANKITISPSGGVTIESNNITLAATGNLTLSGDNVQIKGNQVGIEANINLNLKSTNIKLEAQNELDIKAYILKLESQTDLNIAATSLLMKANASAKLTGGATVEVSSSGVNTIKGSMVLIN
jgi:hypothetical protein